VTTAYPLGFAEYFVLYFAAQATSLVHVDPYGYT